MITIAKSADDMISGMTPVLRAGRFVFVSVADPALAERIAGSALATFREDEGLSLILDADSTAAAGFDVSTVMRCITLQVYSSLEGVGLTAAVASALAAEGIACNMVAAIHHDHVLVPEAQADAALAILQALQESAGGEQRQPQSL